MIADSAACFAINRPAKSHVLPQRFQKRQPALLAVGLFGLLYAAKFTACCVLRFLGGHAAANIFFRKRLQMRAQLVVQILIATAFAK